MKKILSVLFLALLGVTTIEAADFYAHAAAKVATEAQGMGSVCVTTTNATPTEGWSDLSFLNQKFAGDANSATYNFYYHAKANDGYYFAGWSTTDGGSEMGTDMPPATGSTSGTQAAPNTDAPTYYAMFKPYLHVIQHDKMIRYVNQDGDENINNSVIIVEAKETNISFALSGTNNGLFALVNPQTAQKAASLTVPTKQGLAQVELQYLGNFNDAIGKAAEIVKTYSSHVSLQKDVPEKVNIQYMPLDNDVYLSIVDGSFKIYKDIVGRMKCRFSVKLKSEVDREIKIIALSLVYPDLSFAFIFRDIPPMGELVQNMITSGKICYNLNGAPDIHVNKCGMKNTMSTECVSHIKWDNRD